MLNKFVAATVACTALGFGALPALAESWDLSNEYPATSLQGQTADFFAKAVAEKTGGKLEITVHHGAALGYKSTDSFDAVGDGALQAAALTSAPYTVAPSLRRCLAR